MKRSNAPKGQPTNKRRAQQGGPNARPKEQKAGPKQRRGNAAGRQAAKGSGSGAVPPLDAFNRVKRMPPPNLPGQEGYVPPGESPAAPAAPAAAPKNTAGGAQKKRKGAAPKGPKTGSAQRQNTPKQQAKPNRQAEPRQVKKQKPGQTPAQRRMKRRIAAIAMVLILIATGVTLTVTMLFKVENYVVEGDSHYTKEEITAAFGYGTGGNIFGFNAQNAAQRLATALPYLEEITIRRRLPTTVVFKVTAAQEKYYIPVEEQFAILSSSQKVLRLADTEPQNLVRIEGVGKAGLVPGLPLTIEDTIAADALHSLIAQLEARGIADVTLLDVSDPTKTSFRWKNRFTVVVGTQSNMAEKLEFAFLILTDTGQSGLADTDKGQLDVSGYPANPNVVYRPEAAAVSTPPPKDTSPASQAGASQPASTGEDGATQQSTGDSTDGAQQADGADGQGTPPPNEEDAQ